MCFFVWEICIKIGACPEKNYRVIFVPSRYHGVSLRLLPSGTTTFVTIRYHYVWISNHSVATCFPAKKWPAPHYWITLQRLNKNNKRTIPWEEFHGTKIIQSEKPATPIRDYGARCAVGELPVADRVQLDTRDSCGVCDKNPPGSSWSPPVAGISAWVCASWRPDPSRRGSACRRGCRSFGLASDSSRPRPSCKKCQKSTWSIKMTHTMYVKRQTRKWWNKIK